jgi:uncharacterized protein YpmB
MKDLFIKGILVAMLALSLAFASAYKPVSQQCIDNVQQASATHDLKIVMTAMR